MVGVSVACSSIELVPSVDLLYSGGYKKWGVSVACSSIELVRSVDLLYSGGYRWWGVSIVCSSIEFVPTVIRPTVQWWIQMVGVSIVCTSIELVPTVIRPTVQWRIQMLWCQCRLFLCKAGAECNKTYCTVVDTNGGVSLSPFPVCSCCRL